MSKEIDWSKAPEGATHYHPQINGYVEHWVKPDHFCTLGFEASGWRCSPNMIRDTSALISRPSPWNSAELPPVGTFVHVYGGGLIYGQGESGPVLAHVEDTAVIRMSYGLGCFRSECLRTAEQIATDQKKREIETIMRDTDYILDEIHASAVIAAGYRKCSE